MKKTLYQKRSQRIRKKLKSINTDRFRLSVYKSLKNISAQIIDDKSNKTLVAASSLKEKPTGKNKKGDLSIILKTMGQLSATDRPIIGQKSNSIKIN